MISHYNLDGYLQLEGILIFYIWYRGVPIKYYKNIIEMLFAKNFNLEQSCKKYQTLFYDYYRKNGNKMEVVTFQE